MQAKQLKKFTLAAIAGLALAAPLTAAPAQAADYKIGVVDVQKILLGSELNKQLQEATKQLEAEENHLKDEYDKRRQDLIKKQATMKEEEFIALQRKYEDEMNTLRQQAEDKLKQKRESMMKIKEKLEKSMGDAVSKVAGQKGIQLVLSKQVVIYGGVDITDDVQKAL